MKCHECISFADGVYRNSKSRRRDVGFFQKACDLAEELRERGFEVSATITRKIEI